MQDRADLRQSPPQNQPRNRNQNDELNQQRRSTATDILSTMALMLLMRLLAVGDLLDVLHIHPRAAGLLLRRRFAGGVEVQTHSRAGAMIDARDVIFHRVPSLPA